MKVTITNRNVELKEDVKPIITEKAAKLDLKYRLKITGMHVMLAKKKYIYWTEVQVKAKELDIVGTGESEKNIYVAIDDAISRIENQLRKHKEKIKEKKGKQVRARKEKEEGFADLISEEVANGSQGADVTFERVALKAMSVAAAAAQMDLVPSREFMVFSNVTNGEMNVIYRTKKGTLSVIQQAQ